MLAEKLRHSVPDPIRSRGDGYWNRGAVQIVADEVDRLEAIVDGSVEYEVGIYRGAEEGTVDGVCTCPYFLDRSLVCKHIWALVVAGGQAGALSGLSDSDQLRLEPAPHRLGDLFLIEALDLDPRERNGSTGVAPATEPELPSWREALSTVVRPEPARERSELAWMGDERQIVYRIDVAASKQRGDIVLDLLARDRRKDRSWGALKSTPLRRSMIAKLPHPTDRQLVALIVGGRGEPEARGWADAISIAPTDRVPSRFTLPRAVLPTWLRMAAATGRLTLAPDPEAATGAAENGAPENGDRPRPAIRRRPPERDWLPLEWDPANVWALELQIEETGEFSGAEADVGDAITNSPIEIGTGHESQMAISIPPQPTADRGLRLTGALVRYEAEGTAETDAGGAAAGSTSEEPDAPPADASPTHAIDHTTNGSGTGESGFSDEEADRRPLSEPELLSAAGLVFFHDRFAKLDDGGAFTWIPTLRREPEIRIPAHERHAFVETFLNLDRPELCALPPSLVLDEVQGEAVPELTVRPPDDWPLQDRGLLHVHLAFSYGDDRVPWEDARSGLYQPAAARFVFRDRAAEVRAYDRLISLGAREEPIVGQDSQTHLLLPERSLTRVVHRLAEAGWRVDVEGRRYRSSGVLDLRFHGGRGAPTDPNAENPFDDALRPAARTDIDWFDLRGRATFDTASVALPELLSALRRGEHGVTLDDGSIGLLPMEWSERLRALTRLAQSDDEGLRFGRHQIGLIDALIAAQPEIGFDDAVAQAREQLEGFSGVEPRTPPAGFQGTLRDYQQDGLGWLHFLAEFGFGGCLADDMGLGKTVQVLALLEDGRVRRLEKPEATDAAGPSLIVVPKSIVFNWLREAERFTPELRILEYTGPKREKLRPRFSEVDAVLTTYGTMRRDIAFLRTLDLDYAILDEAQAIKNAKSATAKASRLLQARHRLALTGTPIENHVGELMSLLDFLNPGLFGRDRGLRVPKAVRDGALSTRSEPVDDEPSAEDGAELDGGATEDAKVQTDDAEARSLALIAGAARPFILRRTKGEVAKDLPEKVEQTLYCELPEQQREDYDRLLAHYRNAILGRVDSSGLGRSKIHVLEALLRLRQAACHPGLIDASRQKESSAKLDVFLPQIEEVIEEGHKALVFSQFTTMLSIVRHHLDERGISYEYLDGKTRKREPKIERFQNDPDCPLFLISLKAGGVGLNLTAAEYVFLLDPWWNPAVEAQAIDRTHRIGQTRPVFAYSLIARDTIEEKIQALQQKKRSVADAVVQADTSLIKNLTREELAELLS